jgi:hypothetical protein
MAQPSSKIPTFDDYMKGKVSINNEDITKIINASSGDKNESNTKLSTLTTKINNEIQRLNSECSPFSRATPTDKQTCRIQIEAHQHNVNDFIKLHNAILGVASYNTKIKGGKKQTRRHSKYNNTKHNNKTHRKMLGSRRRKNKK